MIGNEYWTTGITVKSRETPKGQAWGASLQFYDDGFANDDPHAESISTEGTLGTRYFINDGGRSGLSVALDVLVADAKKLGIRLRGPAMASAAALYMEGDGESPDVDYPDGWRATLDAEEQRLGWAPLTGEMAPASLTSGAAS